MQRALRVDRRHRRARGITGESELVVRTALSSMVEDAEAGTLTSSTEGLAVWPELRVRLPVNQQTTDAAD